MQVTPADIVSLTSAQASTSASVRVVAGNLASVPLGALLQAVVTQVTPRAATLEVNGQSVTVQPPTGLQTGAVLFVRVPPSGGGTLEIAGRAAAPKAEPPSVPVGSTQVKVVDILEPLPDGRVRVRIDGQEQTATARDPLTRAEVPFTPGGRVVLQVTQTPAGPVLQTPPATPTLPTAVATAILQATPTNNLPAALQPLQAELDALIQQPAGQGGTTIPSPVRDAAAAVRDTVRSLLPADGRAPTATDLQTLVENGGQQFEAKLARLAADPELAAGTARQVAAEVTGDLKGDLKGDLLRLIQTTRELGVLVQLPAARAALDGIEAQQATQTLARETGTPYILQVPFPDRDGWRTLHLAVEPEERSATDDEQEQTGPGRFRMLMHVPLSELGETWIDAGLAGDRFRASIYLARADVQARVQAALPELRAELGTDGFAEVLLDVKAAAELPARTRQRSAAMLAGRPESSSLLDVRA